MTGTLSPLQVFAMRLQQRIGWAGLTGVGLLLLSGLWLGIAWQAHRVPLPEVPAVAELHAPKVQTAPALDLARRYEVPVLLAQIRQAVVGQGLPWTAADYKILPATDSFPAVLEVRSSLKGPYPKLRVAIGELQRGVMGLVVRDLSMTRASIDATEVDAKITLGVLLRDEPAAPAAGSRSGGS